MSYVKNSALLFVVAVTMMLAPSAKATAIFVDAGWYGFCFDGPGSGATEGCQNAGIGAAGNPITFSSAAPIIFQITDAFNIGDSFTVDFNSGAFTLTTPSVAAVGDSGSDPDAAFANPLASSGSILLPAGVYSAEVFAVDSPFDGGGAYLQVISAVPEPSTMLLMGLGLCATGLLKRKAFRS